MIEYFTKLEFEQALPTGYWSYSGLIDGEHTYSIEITPDIFITIRSSVKNDGQSADTGKDSIRAWLCSSDGKPLGSKTQKWVTRLPNWKARLLDMLRELWRRAKTSGYCEKCNVPKSIYKVTKQGHPKKGKLFCKCSKCGEGFKYLEDK